MVQLISLAQASPIHEVCAWSCVLYMKQLQAPKQANMALLYNLHFMLPRTVAVLWECPRLIIMIFINFLEVDQPDQLLIFFARTNFCEYGAGNEIFVGI